MCHGARSSTVRPIRARQRHKNPGGPRRWALTDNSCLLRSHTPRHNGGKWYRTRCICSRCTGEKCLWSESISARVLHHLAQGPSFRHSHGDTTSGSGGSVPGAAPLIHWHEGEGRLTLDPVSKRTTDSSTRRSVSHPFAYHGLQYLLEPVFHAWQAGRP
jgi:hypothetical protein